MVVPFNRSVQISSQKNTCPLTWIKKSESLKIFIKDNRHRILKAPERLLKNKLFSFVFVKTH